jgi:ABC-type lipopolysaccharide export system ATPase subunit
MSDNSTSIIGAIVGALTGTAGAGLGTLFLSISGAVAYFLVKKYGGKVHVDSIKVAGLEIDNINICPSGVEASPTADQNKKV